RQSRLVTVPTDGAGWWVWFSFASPDDVLAWLLSGYYFRSSNFATAKRLQIKIRRHFPLQACVFQDESCLFMLPAASRLKPGLPSFGAFRVSGRKIAARDRPFAWPGRHHRL
ncbi:MAG: hypothetical protein V3S53_04710, partial [Gammaproteobacteria bacterium]